MNFHINSQNNAQVTKLFLSALKLPNNIWEFHSFFSEIVLQTAEISMLKSCQNIGKIAKMPCFYIFLYQNLKSQLLKWGIYTFKAVVDNSRSDKKIWSCGHNFDNSQENNCLKMFLGITQHYEKSQCKQSWCSWDKNCLPKKQNGG